MLSYGRSCKMFQKPGSGLCLKPKGLSHSVTTSLYPTRYHSNGRPIRLQRVFNQRARLQQRAPDRRIVVCTRRDLFTVTKRARSTSGRCLDLIAHLLKSRLEHAARIAVTAAACGALMLGQVVPASAESYFRIPIPANGNPEVFVAQQTMLQAWKIVTETYADELPDSWGADLAEGLISAAEAKTGEEAYERIPQLLDRLHDPYTRIIPAREYQDFRVGSEGELQGVGLMITQDPASRQLLVLGSLGGSPAARAGIQPGDEVVSIDGTSAEGINSDHAASLLRGTSGTKVAVRFLRRTQQVPGVAGRPESPPQVRQFAVNLRRERLEVNPVFSTAFAHPGPKGQDKTGYIRLMNFNQHAAADVRKAIRDLKMQGAGSFILDLRHNPGGLVRSGMDVARLFLDAPAPIFNVSARTAEIAEDDGSVPRPIMQEIVLARSRAMTRVPLAVLLDGQSASASEILAGALRDNGHRAVLIGDAPTYGKGKIQNVFELGDGSALFVTVARYMTPAHAEIDQVGIRPDMACKVPDFRALGTNDRKAGPLPLGLPPGLALQFAGEAALEEDACVQTAERVLATMVASKF